MNNWDHFWPGLFTGVGLCALAGAALWAYAFTGDNTGSEVSPEVRAEMAEMQAQYGKYAR